MNGPAAIVEVGGVLPTTLREQIVYELAHAGGPMLRHALRTRCNLASSEMHFTSEFGLLVLEGRVALVDGAGPRATYALSAVAKAEVQLPQPSSRFGRRPDAKAIAFNRVGKNQSRYEACTRRRQQVLEALADGAWLAMAEVIKRAGVPQGSASYLLTSMVNEGALVRHGRRQGAQYRLASLASDGVLPSTDVVSPARSRRLARLEQARSKVLDHLLANGASTARQIMGGTGITWGDKAAALCTLVQQGKVLSSGRRNQMLYRLPGTPLPVPQLTKPKPAAPESTAIASAGDDSITVRIRLKQPEIEPFFAWLKSMKAEHAGASA